MTELSTPDPDGPDFGYQILRCDSFATILAGEGEPLTPADLVDQAMRNGRVLLQAKGGAGKSATLARIAASARATEFTVTEVWSVEWVEAATALAQGDSDGLRLALGSVCRPALPPEGLGDDSAMLILVDGLNEVASAQAREVVEVVDDLAAQHPQVGFVVADRLARRDVGQNWKLATLTPVPAETIQEIAPGNHSAGVEDLLSSPFYLESVRRSQESGQPIAVGANTHRAFITAHASLSPDEVQTIGSVVFEAYAEFKSRSMPTAWLSDRLSATLIERLTADGTLVDRDGRVWFAHHLMSDFFAAVQLASRTDEWDPGHFGVLTFTASSFDALPMLLEEAPDESGDTLARSVFDWNLYGSAYLVAEDRENPGRISPDMKFALRAMLADKLFDPIDATVEAVRDALTLDRSDDAQALLTVSGHDDLFALVAQRPGTASWFDAWKALFLRHGAEANVEEATLVADPDGIMGWTASNVLKRLTLSAEVTMSLRQMLGHESPTVRWRAAHALGAAEPVDVEGDLLARVADESEDQWVRYGAVRSLVELAGRTDPGTRRQILDDIGSVAHAINGSVQLTREVTRSLHLVEPPHDWSEDAGLLLEKLWADGETVEQQDHWRQVSLQLRLGA